MSLESFAGFEQGEGMDAGSFERFKEKMAHAAAQIAAIKKEEGKQKKKEDKLIKILLQFIKNSHKTDLILLISRALEQNIPANFVLAIILLGNDEIQQAVGDFALSLKSGVGDLAQQALEGPTEQNLEAKPEDQALAFFQDDASLPLKVKIELDAWLKGMLYQAEERPGKLLKTAYQIEMIEIAPDDDAIFGEKKYREEKSIKTTLPELAAHILSDFLDQHQLSEPKDKLLKFTSFILQGILNKTQENLDSRKALGGDTIED